MSSHDCKSWEALFNAGSGAEFDRLLRDAPLVPGSVHQEIIDNQARDLATAIAAHGVELPRPSRILVVELSTPEQVSLVGEALRASPAYDFRKTLITLLGRSEKGTGVFPILRDHFWRVDRATDTQMDSERFASWAANYRHATLADVDDLLDAARATEHGHHRGMAVEALGRFRKRLDEFEDLLIELIEEPGVDQHAVAAVRRLKLGSAAEPVRRLRDRAEDPWLRQQCNKALRAIGALD